MTSVSVNINSGAKMSILCKKKLKFWEKCWHKFFEEIEQFSGKGVNLVVNFGKNGNWF